MGLILRTSWRLSRSSTLLVLAGALGQILDFLLPLFIGLSVTGVATGDARYLVAGVAGAAVARGRGFLLGSLGTQARLDLNEKMGHYFDVQVATMSGELVTVEHLDDPRLQDHMQALRERMGVLGWAYNSLINSAYAVIGAVTTLTIAAAVDPRLLLLVVVAVPATLAVRAAIRWEKRAEESGAAAGRQSIKLGDICASPVGSGEVRIFGARQFMLGLIGAATIRWRRPYTEAAVKRSWMATVFTGGYLMASVALLAWMVHDALAGRVSAGQIAAAFAVVGQLRDSVSSFQWGSQMFARTLRTVSRYRTLVTHSEAAQGAVGVGAVPDLLSDGISLERVTYRYPGSEQAALIDVSLRFPAGSVTAIVGDNGAGKSTLVGLLTGMRSPIAGHVRIDGVDLTKLSMAEWRLRASGAFQDHVRFELLAGEAIGIGDLSGAVITDDEALRAALDEASSADLMTVLPRGPATQLGESWPDGIGLSGGQWQRIALARALRRPSPALLVLDEPTAALDAAAEHALFGRYANAARKTVGQGGVTIVVTHRFSTVAMADNIVVLVDGKVIEQGTHQQLMAVKGHYAELYALQAGGYRTT
ncbi:ABC transporter ATP-binding protein [Actinoplanes sp. NPDC049596]|uniref:ABC transporter ATP-binding protein n=1 Tax=unclassified Actinoplanes TaxID=2626549 RepID=UPI00341ACA58